MDKGPAHVIRPEEKRKGLLMLFYNPLGTRPSIEENSDPSNERPIRIDRYRQRLMARTPLSRNLTYLLIRRLYRDFMHS